jgi:hypothetical protein
LEHDAKVSHIPAAECTRGEIQDNLTVFDVRFRNLYAWIKTIDDNVRILTTIDDPIVEGSY